MQLLTYHRTNTFMLWRICVAKIIAIHWVTVLLQASKVNLLTAKCLTSSCFFLLILFLFYFLRTPLVVCGLIYSVLVFLISQPYATRFQWNLSYPLYYAYSTSTGIFRVILLLDITPEHTLHSRVKSSITHNSIVIWSSKFNGRLIG